MNNKNYDRINDESKRNKERTIEKNKKLKKIKVKMRDRREEQLERKKKKNVIEK